MVDTLAPPTMAATGRCGASSALASAIEFGLHGAAGIGGKRVAEAFGRGVGAVGDRKRVVDPDVAERGERGDEAGSFVYLAGVEAGVLEAEDVAVLHRGDGRDRRRADAIVGKGDVAPEMAGERGGDRLAANPWRCAPWAGRNGRAG